MVKKGMKIMSAAKVLKIKESTAKMIMKKYRERHPEQDQSEKKIEPKIEEKVEKEEKETGEVKME